MTRSGDNRPLKYGAANRREYIVSDGEQAIRAQNDGSGNAIYLAKAKVGTLTSETGWSISFQVYDGSNAITSKTWPQNSLGNASSEYEFIYDDRAGFTYS